METRKKLLCKTNIVKGIWERGRINDGTQYAKACFTMQGAHVANVVHRPKRTTQYSELYRCADELTKKRPCMSAMYSLVGNGAEGMPTATHEKGLMHGRLQPLW